MTTKIKEESLYNSIEEGSLKNIEINLQCSCLNRLYDDKFHEWNLIPLNSIKSTFWIIFKLHSNLDFDDSTILTFSTFYKLLFRNWCKYLSSFVNIPSSILSQSRSSQYKVLNTYFNLNKKLHTFGLSNTQL